MAAPAKGTFEAAFERWTDPIVNVSDFIWGGSWHGKELLPFPPMVIVLSATLKAGQAKEPAWK